MPTRDSYFSEGSTDAILAQSLRDGDVVLISKRCTSLFSTNPLSALLCYASKYGLSGEGRHCWDHAAVVVHSRGVPFLLEGGAEGVTMRTYEERLLQGADHQEVMLLPLRNLETSMKTGEDLSAEDRRRASALGGLMEELQLKRTPDGLDAPGATCCQNTWAAYRTLRQPYSRRRTGFAAAAAGASAAPLAEESSQPAPCTFGAPLVATALQRLGALEPAFDPARVTPASLPNLPMVDPLLFGRPVPVRTLANT